VSITMLVTAKQAKQMRQSAKPRKQKPQKKQPKPKNGPGQIKNRFHLGMCTSKFAASLADPFEGPPDACMPVTPSVQSRKVRMWTKGTMTTGTAASNFGFVFLGPCPYGNGTVPGGANMSASVAYSIGTYAGTTFQYNTGTTGVTQLANNSDVNVAAGIQARLVSAGLRIRYKGTELNRGGRIVALEEPDHAGLAGQSLSQLLAYQNGHEFPVTENWVSISTSGPVTPGEYDFLPLNSNNTVTGTTSGTGVSAQPNMYLGFAVEAAAAGQNFDFEAYENWEFIGSAIRGKSYNEADDGGVSAVIGAYRSHNDAQLDSRHPAVPQIAFRGNDKMPSQPALVEQYAAHNTSGWVTEVQGVAETVGGALLAAPNPYAKAAGAVLSLGSKIGGAIYNAFH